MLNFSFLRIPSLNARNSVLFTLACGIGMSVTPFAYTAEEQACTVTYSFKQVAETSTFGTIEITNLSSEPIAGYDLTWTTQGAVAGVWDGSFTQQGTTVTISNSIDDDNGTIPANEGSSILAVQLINLTDPDTQDGTFSLNGVVCETTVVPNLSSRPYAFKDGTMREKICPTTTAQLTTGETNFIGDGYFEFNSSAQNRIDYPAWDYSASDLGNTVSIRIGYANGTGENVYMDAYVNGKLVSEALEFPPTSSWSDWQEIALSGDFRRSVSLSLVATTSINLPLIDAITVGWTQECAFDCLSGGISYSPGNTDGTNCLAPVPGLPSEENQAPIAMLDTYIDDATPQTIYFKGLGSLDPNGDELQYQWDFGDGTESSEGNVRHTYTSPGVYTVSLSVSDGELSDTVTDTFTISGPPANDTLECNANLYPWGNGYVADIKVTNSGQLPSQAAVSGTLVFSAPVSVNSAWGGATISPTAPQIQIPFLINQSIASEQTAYFGFWGGHSSTALTITDCLINTP